MEKFRVLSIDWDYFIKANLAQRASLFPDGNTWNQTIEAHIWASHYQTYKGEPPELNEIGVYHQDMNNTIAALQRMCWHPDKNNRKTVCIAHNHDSIYRVVLDAMKRKYPNEKVALRVVNLDFHHDAYTDVKLDAGNWVYHFYKQAPDRFSYKWVRRPTSDMTHSLINLPKKSYGLTAALNEDYDFIFICKSGLWSPPHLDSYFKLLCSPVVEAARKDFVYGVAETDVLEDRMKVVKPLVKQLEDATRKIISSTKK